LGVWTRANHWASWEFKVAKPGHLRVEVQQGCGKHQGGSELQTTSARQTLRMVLQDTGHFQNYKVRVVGSVPLDHAGRHTMTVKANSEQGIAAMHLSSVALKPAG
jgi:hypothetical protein